MITCPQAVPSPCYGQSGTRQYVRDSDAEGRRGERPQGRRELPLHDPEVIVIEQLGLADDKDVSTPGVYEDYLAEDTQLVGEGITRFRRVIARRNCLGTDRPVTPFAIKKGCSEMSSPTRGSLRRLTRIRRFCKRYPTWPGSSTCRPSSRR